MVINRWFLTRLVVAPTKPSQNLAAAKSKGTIKFWQSYVYLECTGAFENFDKITM